MQKLSPNAPVLSVMVVQSLIIDGETSSTVPHSARSASPEAVNRKTRIPLPPPPLLTNTLPWSSYVLSSCLEFAALRHLQQFREQPVKETIHILELLHTHAAPLLQIRLRVSNRTPQRLHKPPLGAPHTNALHLIPAVLAQPRMAAAIAGAVEAEQGVDALLVQRLALGALELLLRGLCVVAGVVADLGGVVLDALDGHEQDGERGDDDGPLGALAREREALEARQHVAHELLREGRHHAAELAADETRGWRCGRAVRRRRLEPRLRHHVRDGRVERVQRRVAADVHQHQQLERLLQDACVRGWQLLVQHVDVAQDAQRRAEEREMPEVRVNEDGQVRVQAFLEVRRRGEDGGEDGVVVGCPVGGRRVRGWRPVIHDVLVVELPDVGWPHLAHVTVEVGPEA